MQARITFESLEAEKRPVAAVADHVEVRDVRKVEIAEDRKRSATLLFDPGHSLAERVLAEQFRFSARASVTLSEPLRIPTLHSHRCELREWFKEMPELGELRHFISNLIPNIRRKVIALEARVPPFVRAYAALIRPSRRRLAMTRTRSLE